MSLSPTTWLIAALVAVLLIAVLWPSRRARLIARARKTRDIAPLVALLDATTASQRATAYNTVVKQVWDAYDRPLAAELVRAMARVERDAFITQYWIRQILEVEPELAEQSFDEDFLHSYYQPAIAAQCDKVSS